MSDASPRASAPVPPPHLLARFPRAALTLAWATCLGALAGCGKSEPPPPAATTATPAPKGPVDHLAPGELIDGEARAFGLPLPRGLSIVSQVSGQITGETEAPPEHVSNYFRARVGGGKITVGTTSTMFARVRAKADPAKELDIRVEQTRNGSRVDIMDVTRPAGPVPTSAAAALKEVGLDPAGRPAKQME
ncbi:MAG TPA: hypothetical protein PLR99_12670 [Polyangiaceae bacterium]|nr:hypothetical protein [Polyangiaceae bacterium]